MTEKNEFHRNYESDKIFHKVDKPKAENPKPYSNVQSKSVQRRMAIQTGGYQPIADEPIGLPPMKKWREIKHRVEMLYDSGSFLELEKLLIYNKALDDVMEIINSVGKRK